MITLRYFYHCAMAWLYNDLATAGSNIMRKAGRASNYHEAKKAILGMGRD